MQLQELCLVLWTSLFPLTSAFPMQEEGDVVPREALVQAIPPSAEHPVAREVVEAEEQEIDSRPEPKKILAIHYRAKPTAPYSLNDDRVVVALCEPGLAPKKPGAESGAPQDECKIL